jgi:uncharacterized protein (UPF0335 family)
MAKTEFSIESITSNETAKKRLLGFIEEAILANRKIKTEQETLKDIRNEAKDSIGIPPKVFNKLLRLQLEGASLDQEMEELEKIGCLNEMLEAVK